MDIVRNCINIVGITPGNNLPKKVNGQLIETSQAENLFIDDSIKIKNIYQIVIDIDIARTNVINGHMNTIVVVDLIKKFKINYYDMDGNMGILELNSPYNVFFDLESNKVEIENININIADAYFELINSRTLYNHILYIIDVQYLGSIGNKNKIISFSEETKNKENYDYSIIENKKIYEKGMNNLVINKSVIDNVDNGKGINIKYNTLNEVSLSEDNKAQINQENLQYIEKIKNELVDMEDEYL
jgi:hypothetical protein